MSAIASARPALARFRRGSLDALSSSEELLRGEPACDARAFYFAFSATRTLYGVSDSPLPVLEDARGLLENALTTSDGVAELCRVMVRVNLLAFDLESMSKWHELHSSLVSNSREQYEWYAATALWLDLMHGRPAMAEEAETRLRRLDPNFPLELKIELLTLCALGTLLLNNPKTALVFADEACALAASENLVEWRTLTSLARCRILRYLLKPELAHVLLERLAETAAPAFRPWITWEATLAAGSLGVATLEVAPNSTETAGASPGQRAWRAVHELSRLIQNAETNSANVQVSKAALSKTLSGVRPMLYEVQLLVGSLDYTQSPSRVLRSWCWGQDPLPPGGLHGIASSGRQTPTPTSFAILQRGHVGRRVLGVALASTIAPFGDNWSRIEGSTLPQTALAALALADHAELNHADLFRHTYGIEYIRRLHQRLFTALAERMQSLLGEAGELTVRHKTVSLTLRTQALVIFDPRTVQPYSERVLASLLQAEHGTVAEFSGRLSMPERLVRNALNELAAFGAASRVGPEDAELFALHPDLERAAPASLARPKTLNSEPPSRRTGT